MTQLSAEAQAILDKAAIADAIAHAKADAILDAANRISAMMMNEREAILEAARLATVAAFTEAFSTK